MWGRQRFKGKGIGDRFKTAAYKWFETEALYKLPPQDKIIATQLDVKIVFYFEHPLKCDVDNYIKPVLDVIVKKQYIIDDRYITHLNVWKTKGDLNNEGFEIEIVEL